MDDALIKGSVSSAVNGCAGLGQKYTALTKLLGEDFFSKTDPVACYAIDALKQSMHSCTTTSSKDCRALAEVALALKSETFLEE